jgi:hypothetical protein
MVNKGRPKRVKAAAATRAKKRAEIIGAEEQILRAATIHLIRKVGGLFVATGLRKTREQGLRGWVITVTLRHPTGHEGYVGDLFYDGKEFRMLTEESAIDERVRQITADPEGIRRWDEYRASSLRTRKA